MDSIYGTIPKTRMQSTNKDSDPQTPKRSRQTRYPLSSPYSGKSPLPMPILLPSQYNNPESISSVRFTEVGLVTKKLGFNESLPSIGLEDDIDDNMGNKIELFDKTIGKNSVEIPAVGCSLNELPFFDDEKATKFTTALQNINKQANALKKTNDIIVELNESLGAYLFGLFENAWCVNLSENISMETLEKIEKVKQLQTDIKKLQTEVENAKRTSILQKEQRRKSTMPPPSIPRFSTGKITETTKPSFLSRQKQKRRFEEDKTDSTKATVEPLQKRRFLKAGSKTSMFRLRNSQNTRNNYSLRNSNDHNFNKKIPQLKPSGLNLSYATKIQTIPLTDDSMTETSGSDTSEVQTLNTIKRIQSSSYRNQHDNSIRNRDRNRSRNENRNGNGTYLKNRVHRKNDDNDSWVVHHAKPFR